MSVAEPGLQRLQMSWDDYLQLPDKPRAEWVDGEVVVSPFGSAAHGYAAARLMFLLQRSLPGLIVLGETGLWLPRNRLRGPDVMVLERLPTTTWVEDVPVLVVEVLSPSTRAEDTIRKAPEYAGAGIDQYWLVDPAHRTIDVHVNDDGAWSPLLHLDAGSPVGEVVVGEHGVVPVDVREVLPT